MGKIHNKEANMRTLTPYEYDIIAAGCQSCFSHKQFLENVLMSAASGITVGVFTIAAGMGPGYVVAGFVLGTFACATITTEYLNPIA